MNEYLISHYSGLAGIGLVISAWLYSLGGRGHKWIRRFICPAALTITVIGISFLMHRFSWWLVLTYPALMTNSFGYGGDAIGEKILSRTAFAVSNILVGLVLALIFRGTAFWIFPLHAFVALGTIYFAVKNPVYAPAEEFWVAMLLYLGVIMYPFIVS